MVGTRLYPAEDGTFHIGETVPGCYLFWKGAWYGRTPNGLLCGLRNHQVTEHEDGTITASPSIRVTNGEGGDMWHGFLKAGVWEECT